MNKIHSNNKGLTLVELIVVVAIMGIVSIGGISGINLIYSTSAKETSSKLNSALNRARTEAMSRSQASLDIYEQDSEYYVKFKINGAEEAPIRVGTSRVNVSYTDTQGNTKKLTAPNSLKIEFDRETGAFKPLDSGSGDAYLKKITVSSGTKVYTITCERLTGKTKLK